MHISLWRGSLSCYAFSSLAQVFLKSKLHLSDPQSDSFSSPRWYYGTDFSLGSEQQISSRGHFAKIPVDGGLCYPQGRPLNPRSHLAILWRHLGTEVNANKLVSIRFARSCFFPLSSLTCSECRGRAQATHWVMEREASPMRLQGKSFLHLHLGGREECSTSCFRKVSLTIHNWHCPSPYYTASRDTPTPEMDSFYPIVR